MRATGFALVVLAALQTMPTFGHGPQIQITRDENTIITRRLFLDEPYAPLSSPKRAYVIPLLETGGVWYSRPNNEPSHTLPGQPKYLSGPGIAYGMGQSFAGGSRFELNLIDGLKWWDGFGFVDPGSEEIEAYRSSGSAVTNDALTPSSPATLLFSLLPASYGTNAHSSASFRLLGDGISPTASSDDGVYLLTMSLTSTQLGSHGQKLASDPFYFVLHKNASAAEVQNAVSSLNLAAALVQYVPEPGSAGLFLGGVGWLVGARHCRRFGRQKRRG